MTILKETIIFLLSQIYKVNKNNLSKTELFKLLYLIETESYRYTQTGFFDGEVLFTRDSNGPISVDIYKALDDLVDFVQIKKEKNTDYPHSRHSISLKKNVKHEYKKLTQDRKLFINSVLLSFGGLNIKELKEEAYKTEPMLDMRKQEKKKGVECLKGDKLNFKTVKFNKEMQEVYGRL